MRSMRSAQRQVELRRLFTLFRPLCPAFSFTDVDTYGGASRESQSSTSFISITSNTSTLIF